MRGYGEFLFIGMLWDSCSFGGEIARRKNFASAFFFIQSLLFSITALGHTRHLCFLLFK